MSGDDGDVTSLLTFVVADCQEWLYVDGGVTVLGQKIYFEVEDEGAGPVTGPLSYPPKLICLFFFFSFSFSFISNAHISNPILFF